MDKWEEEEANYEHIFPIEENPDWSLELMVDATVFWKRWIGPNVIGYDKAIMELCELIDEGIKLGKKMGGK